LTHREDRDELERPEGFVWLKVSPISNTKSRRYSAPRRSLWQPAGEARARQTKLLAL